MKEKYNNDNLFVVLPSIIKNNKIIQNPNDITIVQKEENNYYINVFNKEKVYYFNKDKLNEGIKYIGVFKNDLTSLSNYIFSLHSDNIKNLDLYVKVIKSIKPEYTNEDLEFIISFLQKEIQNIEYIKEKKLTIKKRIKYRG